MAKKSKYRLGKLISVNTYPLRSGKYRVLVKFYNDKNQVSAKEYLCHDTQDALLTAKIVKSINP